MDQKDSYRRLLIRNDVKELFRITDFLEQLWQDWDLPVKLMYSINLVLEEAISNIIFYAFDDTLVHLIGLEFRLENDTLSMILIDGGKPFDPTQKEDPDTSLSVEDRPIGGLGIFLIKQLMNEVRYERVNGKNELIMIKKIKEE
jgi:anti-sigma regulatory factor (Ser/Thr protein kinase)